jgi:hypothetical protein
MSTTAATTAATTDSNLSGQPSDNIDQQKGPSIGSNAESPGGTFGAAAATGRVQGGNNSSNQGSTGQGSWSGNNNNV